MYKLAGKTAVSHVFHISDIRWHQCWISIRGPMLVMSRQCCQLKYHLLCKKMQDGSRVLGREVMPNLNRSCSAIEGSLIRSEMSHDPKWFKKKRHMQQSDLKWGATWTSVCRDPPNLVVWSEKRWHEGLPNMKRHTIQECWNFSKFHLEVSTRQVSIKCDCPFL